MITYLFPVTSVKKYLQCYRLYNFPYFRSSHWMCSVRKGILRNFSKFTGKHLWQSLFFNEVAGWGACFWSFSCLLSLKISCLFHFNRKMKWKMGNTRTEIKYSLIFLTSKISKEILQMVIWSENVFKGNLMSQFSWLEEFCWGNVSGWWSLGELQYENGLNDKLQTLHTHF